MQTSNLGEPLLLGDLGLGNDPHVLPLHEDQSDAGTVYRPMRAHLDEDGVELRALVVVRQDGLGQLGVGAHLPAVHLQQSATRGHIMSNCPSEYFAL